MNGPSPPLVVGVSGATDTMLGMRLLELAPSAGVETHLVITPAAQQTRAHETDLSAPDLGRLADLYPARRRPVKGSFENGWPAETRQRVLANWHRYGNPATTTPKGTTHR